jgi:hypothetical protein
MRVTARSLATLSFTYAVFVMGALDPKEGSVLVPEGTRVPLKFAQSISSRSTRPGQAMEFAVAEEVK